MRSKPLYYSFYRRPFRNILRIKSLDYITGEPRDQCRVYVLLWPLSCSISSSRPWYPASMTSSVSLSAVARLLTTSVILPSMLWRFSAKSMIFSSFSSCLCCLCLFSTCSALDFVGTHCWRLTSDCRFSIRPFRTPREWLVSATT